VVRAQPCFLSNFGAGDNFSGGGVHNWVVHLTTQVPDAYVSLELVVRKPKVGRFECDSQEGVYIAFRMTVLHT
jgi:hypothetical protein